MEHETQHCFLAWFAESRNIGALEIAEELDDDAEAAPGWSWREILSTKRSSCIHAVYLKSCGRSNATILLWISKKCQGWHVSHIQDHTKCNCGASSASTWSPLWGHHKLAAGTWTCPFLLSAMLQTDFVARTSWDVCVQLPVASITNGPCAWKTFHLSLAFGIDVWTKPRFCFASFSFSSLSFSFLRFHSLHISLWFCLAHCFSWFIFFEGLISILHASSRAAMDWSSHVRTHSSKIRQSCTMS